MSLESTPSPNLHDSQFTNPLHSDLHTTSIASSSNSSTPLIPTLSRLSQSTTRPALPPASTDGSSGGYTTKTFDLVSRGGKEVWRRSGLNHLWRAEDKSPTASAELPSGTPSLETASSSLLNQRLRTQPLDTSSILYPTLTTHPPPIPHHILVMSFAQIAQSPPTISNDGLFDILLRRLEPWVGEEGEGGYVLIIFAAEGGEVYGYGKSNESRKLPGVGWWVWKYKRIPKKFRKNLKRLYIVHPSLFTRTLLPLIIPFLSPKSYTKLHPLPSLLSLHYTHGVSLKGIDITLPVLEAETKVLRERPDLIPEPSNTAFGRPAMRRQSSDSSLTSWSYHTLTSAVGTAASFFSIPAFGASTISDDMSKNQSRVTGYWHRDLIHLVEECGEQIPPLLVSLRKVILDDCSGTMGIFRRASNSTVSTPIEALLGAPIDAQPNLPWQEIARQDPLFPPKILGRFLMELKSPVIDSGLYTLIRTIKTPEQIRTIFIPALPAAHQLVLSYIVHMFHHLLSHAPQTKMSAFNYATVLAPSLIAGPQPLEDAEMCLEPGKSLPEAMRKAMGGASGGDKERGNGTLVGLLEMWIENWTTVSSSEAGDKGREEVNHDESRPCPCSWTKSGGLFPSNPVVGTPATAPAPVDSGLTTTSEVKKKRSGSIRHSLLGSRSRSRSRSNPERERKGTINEKSSIG